MTSSRFPVPWPQRTLEDWKLAAADSPLGDVIEHFLTHDPDVLLAIDDTDRFLVQLSLAQTPEERMRQSIAYARSIEKLRHGFSSET